MVKIRVFNSFATGEMLADPFWIDHLYFRRLLVVIAKHKRGLSGVDLQFAWTVHEQSACLKFWCNGRSSLFLRLIYSFCGMQRAVC